MALEKKTLQDRINLDISEGKALFLVGRCHIEYWGRSRSLIGAGERFILLKSDGTLLVHAKTGFKPLNWMSAPTDTVAEQTDDGLLIHSQRTKKPFEEMKVWLEAVREYKSFTDLCDRENLIVRHTEKDMKDYLVKHTHLIDSEFRLKSTEYRTPLGYLDIYGKIGNKYAVVELKADRAGLPAALQIVRYKQWLEHNLKQSVKAILMAPSANDNAIKILVKEGIEFKKFNIKKIKPIFKAKHTLEKWVK